MNVCPRSSSCENLGNFNRVGSMFRPATSVDDMMALVGGGCQLPLSLVGDAEVRGSGFGVRRLMEVSATGPNLYRARTCKVSSPRTRKVRGC